MNLSTIVTILQLIPALVLAIKGLEEALPDSGQGAQKLSMLRQILEIANSSVVVLWPAIEKVVGIIVAGMNAVKAKPAAEPVVVDPPVVK